jgi:hypothetical protein
VHCLLLLLYANSSFLETERNMLSLSSMLFALENAKLVAALSIFKRMFILLLNIQNVCIRMFLCQALN